MPIALEGIVFAREFLDHGELVDLVLALYHGGALEPELDSLSPLAWAKRELRVYAARVVAAETPDA